MNSGKLISGLLIGAAAGAILGVLFAPDKGTETRRKISKKSTDLSDGLKEKFNEFVDSVSNRYDDVKESADGLFENGRHVIMNAKQKAKNELS